MDSSRSGRQAPSLLDLCTNALIRNFRHITSATGPDFSTAQLAEIENRTRGLDLTPVTDKLWKRFYETEFGFESANSAIKRLNQMQRPVKWKELYEAKMEETEEALQRMREKLKQRYAESAAQKQNRQIKMTTKIPASRKRKGGNGSSNLTSYKNPLMKKAKIEHLKSCSLNNRKIINNSVMKTGSSSSSGSASRSVPAQVRPNNTSNPTRLNNTQSSASRIGASLTMQFGTSSQTWPPLRPTQARPAPTGMAKQTRQIERPTQARPVGAYSQTRPPLRPTHARPVCASSQTRPPLRPTQARPAVTGMANQRRQIERPTQARPVGASGLKAD